MLMPQSPAHSRHTAGHRGQGDPSPGLWLVSWVTSLASDWLMTWPLPALTWTWSQLLSINQMPRVFCAASISDSQLFALWSIIASLRQFIPHIINIDMTTCDYFLFWQHRSFIRSWSVGSGDVNVSYAETRHTLADSCQRTVKTLPPRLSIVCMR